MLRRVLGLLVLLALCSAGVIPAQPSGVVLGLRLPEPIPKPLPYYATAPDSTSRSVYRTLFIVRQDTSFRIAASPSGLLIPRPEQFWRVGVKRSVYNDWVEDFVWSTPVGAVPEWPGIQPYNGEYCRGHRVQDVLYAGPSYLAFEQRSAGYCEGAAHPWFFNTLAVVPLDSVTHTGLDIDEVLGTAARQTLDAAAQEYLGTLQDPERRALFAEDPDPANWALRHRRGRWRVVGRLDGIDEAAQDVRADLSLLLDVPSTLLGRAPAPLSWSTIQKVAPNAVDAVVSSDQSWVLILHPRRLTAHLIRDGVIGPARLEHRLRPGASIVMDRWATGDRLQTWRQRLRQITEAES